MAKPKIQFSQEQYDMLKRCSEKEDITEWNEWREKNPDIKILLEEAHLSGAFLNRADLSGAFLNRADLSEADLNGANLSGSDLNGADLSEADLSKTLLFEADLSSADLNEAKLIGTYLIKAILYRTKLRNANLTGADLSSSNLEYSDLSMASLRLTVLQSSNLNGVNLYKANLNGADLRYANLSEANLENANLEYAKLNGTNLKNANLTGSKLLRVKLDNSVLTGIKIYACNHTDWSIKEVKCNYIYADQLGNERLPKDRNFEPGEFEKLFQQLPTIEYIFEHGMKPLDIVLMDRIVQEIQSRKPEFEIELQSIDKKGLYPRVTFTVKYEKQKEEALALIESEYQIKNAELQKSLDMLTGGYLEMKEENEFYRTHLKSTLEQSVKTNEELTQDARSLINTINASMEKQKTSSQKLEEISKQIKNIEVILSTPNADKKAILKGLDILQNILSSLIGGIIGGALPK